MTSRSILPVVLLVAGISACDGRPAGAEQQDLPPLTPQRHYNGIIAGEEAYRDNSLRRQAEIGRQFNLSSDVYWRWSGASSWYPGVFEAWPMVPGSVFGWPANPVPPQITPTSIAPPNVVVAEPRPGQRAARGASWSGSETCCRQTGKQDGG